MLSQQSGAQPGFSDPADTLVGMSCWHITGIVERFHIISSHSRQQSTHSSHSQQPYPHRAGAAFSLPSMPPAPPFLQPPGGPSPGGMPTLGGMGGLNAQQVGAVPSTSCLSLLQQQQQYCLLYLSDVAAAPYAAKNV